MNIGQRLEFNKVVEYLDENNTQKDIDTLKTRFQDLRDPKKNKNDVNKAITAIRNYLDFFYRLDQPRIYIEKTSTSTQVNLITFNDALQNYTKSSDYSQLRKVLDNLSYNLLTISKYNDFLKLYDAKNLLKKIDQSIAFTYEIGRPVLYENSLSRMQNVNDLFKLLNTLLGEDEQFEIIHVEDGSLKIFIAASVIMINVVNPLIQSTSKSISSIMDLIHKSDIQNIEKELKKKELRHLKAMNTKAEQLEDIIIDKEIIELKKQDYKNDIENLEKKLQREIKYNIALIDKRYQEYFKHTDNTKKLLEQISQKIEDHFRHGGFINTYLIENNNIDEKESKFSERLSLLSEEQMKLIEGPKNKGK